MVVVGVTGGIGSGKTTVAKLFELLNMPVFYADDEAKKLYDNPKLVAKVVKIFGKKVLSKNKNIDKKKLAEIVFSNKELLGKLNAIIHPLVRVEFLIWKKSKKGAPFVIKEAAIMIESGAIKCIDYLVLVKSTKYLKISRLLKRNNFTKTEIESRIKEQLSDSEREKFADAIVLNDEQHSLIKQVLKLHRKLSKK